MFRMIVESQFSAAHQIKGHPGLTGRLHGHNYRVIVHLTGEELNELGMLIDYAEVKSLLAQVLAAFDHEFLNDAEPFRLVQPTGEVVARLIYHRLREEIARAHGSCPRVAEVFVYESDKQGVGYSE